MNLDNCSLKCIFPFVMIAMSTLMYCFCPRTNLTSVLMLADHCDFDLSGHHSGRGFPPHVLHR